MLTWSAFNENRIRWPVSWIVFSKLFWTHLLIQKNCENILVRRTVVCGIQIDVKFVQKGIFAPMMTALEKFHCINILYIY